MAASVYSRTGKLLLNISVNSELVLKEGRFYNLSSSFILVVLAKLAVYIVLNDYINLRYCPLYMGFYFIFPNVVLLHHRFCEHLPNARLRGWFLASRKGPAFLESP